MNIKRIFPAMLVAITGVSAQITVTSDDSKNVGNVNICNVSAATANVSGARFEFTGTGGWGSPFPVAKNLTHDGKDYRQLEFADWQKNNGLKAAECVGGNAQWGFDGKISNIDPLLNVGGCADPDKPQQTDAITTNDLDRILASKEYYDADYRYLDTLGSNGGEYSARWVDTYFGQTQILVSKAGNPTGTWSVNLKPDNAQTSGPLYWMALASGQELFSMDKQYLMAIGLKETGVGGALDARTTNLDGAYGAFELESFTGISRMLTYPKFYPTFKNCISKSADATGIISCAGGQAKSIMDPIFGANASDVNGASMVNSVIMSGLLIYQYYDAIGAASDYCGRKAFSSEAADPYLGLCAIAAHYNLGINGGVPTSLKSEATIKDADGCNTIPAGNSNYTAHVRKAVAALAKDSKDAFADKTVGIHDFDITLAHVETFFWGDGGSKDAPGSNGLMLHFDIGSEKDKMWTDIQNTFNKLAAHWGGATPHISYRYDWLTLLRVAKGYFDLERPAPQGEEVTKYISTNSGNTACDASLPVDGVWPYLHTASSHDPKNSKGTSVWVFDENANGDAVEPLYVKWSVNGGAWTDAVVEQDASIKTATDHHYFRLVVPEEILPTTGGFVDVRAADSCKNEVQKRIRIETPKQPTFNEAAMYDTDGDGNGDSLVIDINPYSGTETPDVKPEDFTAVSHAWPLATPVVATEKTAATFSSNQIIIKVVDPQFGTKNGSFANVTYADDLSLTGDVKDKVGPAIHFASYLVYKTESVKDTLIMRFKELLSSQFEANKTYFSVAGKEYEVEGYRFAADADAKGLGSHYFTLPKGTLNEGDTVRLLTNAGIKDNALSKNDPHPLNFVVLTKNEGPLGIVKERSFFLDSDGDGTMDQLQVSFNRPGVGYEAQISPELQWPADSKSNKLSTIKLTQANLVKSKSPDVFIWNMPQGSAIRPFATYVGTDIEGWGEVKIVQEDLINNKEVEDKFTPLDKMGPILVNAELKRTSRPDKDDDIMVFRFSEPLAVDGISGSELFEYKTGNDKARALENKTKLTWVAENVVGRVPYDPNALDKPTIGDSVHINSASEAGSVVDNAGNNANVSNPFVIIDGKPVISNFGPVTARFRPIDACVDAYGGKDNIPKGVAEPIFFSNQIPAYDIAYGNAELDIEQYGMGVGFVVNFNDAGKFKRDEIRFNYNIAYYSNLAEVIAYKKGSFGCSELEAFEVNGKKPFEGACSEVEETVVDGKTSYNYTALPSSRDFKVYFPWCYLDDTGSLVGTGAYIQKAEIETSSSASGYKKAKATLTRYIGVKRDDNATDSFKEFEPHLVKPVKKTP